MTFITIHNVKHPVSTIAGRVPNFSLCSGRMPGTGGFGYMTCGYAVSFLNVTTNAPFICVDVAM